MTYLNVNTTHLERKVLKASFGELFRNQDRVERNHGTIFGTPVIDNGVTLNGTTDYVKHDLAGHELNSSDISIVIPFCPEFDWDVDVLHVFCDASAGSRYFVYKAAGVSNNTLIVWLGNISIASIPAATYSPYWSVGGRNLIVISGTSGATNAWLISDKGAVQILTNAATSWSPKKPTEFYTGVNGGGNSAFKFLGKIDSVKIFKSLLTQQDAINYFENTTEILPSPVIHLPMFSGDHVPSSRTLDISNNGYDADFGAGAVEPVKSVTRGYRVDNGDRFAIDEPALGSQVVSISFRIKDITIDPVGSFLWDARRSGGTGFCFIDTSGNLVATSGTPYVNGRQTDVVDLHDSVISLVGHSLNVTEGLDLCVHNTYDSTVDLNADVLEFEMSPETLTHVQVAKVYERMTRRVPSQQASLCSETTPAERALGASFGCLFVNQLRVEALGGTVFGTPVIDNGVTLNGTTDYVKHDLVGDEFNSSEISIVIPFCPEFDWDVNVLHVLCDASAGSRYFVYKADNVSNNTLVVWLGNTPIANIPAATYSP